MRESILTELLSQPTSPFREIHVIRYLLEVLTEHGIPFFEDRVGNVILGASSEKDYLRLMTEKTTEPLRVFIAHMDHPGFHGSSFSGARTLETKWHGGSPTAYLEGSKVWLATSERLLGYAQVTKAEMIASGRAIASLTLELGENAAEIRALDPDTIFGGFAFRAPVWKEQSLIYTKAADDLVGCFALLSLAIELYSDKKSSSKKRSSKSRPPFLGLLTRAEEVGFIGTIGHLELGWWKKAKRPLLAVSLETSRTLPGADIGKGPVVRLGDRYTVFHPGSTRLFTELAEQILPGKHQRRIMDGGSCEGSAATAYGIPTVAISVPLGNYHNQDFEGGPDARGTNGPAPEFVHLDDVAGLIELCRALLKPKLPWATPFAAKMKDFKKSYARYKPLLRGL
jgi:putative aminopeptidase FrvX